MKVRKTISGVKTISGAKTLQKQELKKGEIMRRILTFVTFMALFLSTTVIAQSAEWQPVTGEEKLRNFMSETKMEWEEPGGDKSRGEYRADGTGTLYSWGGRKFQEHGRLKATTRYV